MNLISIVILAVIAVLFVLALRYSITHPDACAGCGSKGACTGSCASCHACDVDPDKIPERFRLKKK